MTGSPKQRTCVAAAAAAAMALSVACSPGQRSSFGDHGGCTKYYEPVANAATKGALKTRLLRDVDPRARSLRVFDLDPNDDKLNVDLLNRRGQAVRSLEMWELDNGTWTAQQTTLIQCID